MTKTLRLVRNYFQCFIGSFASRSKKMKYAPAVFFVVLIAVLMVFVFTNTSIIATSAFIDQGVPYLAMFFNCTMAIMIMLLLTLMRSALPAKTTDEALLLSMPVTKTEIMLAKSFYNYLFDFISLLGILFPTFIVYYVLVDNAPFYVVTNGFILVLLIPLFSNALAYLLGLLMQKIASSFRFYNLFQTVLLLVLTIGFIAIYYSLQGYLMNNINNFDNILRSILPLKWMTEFTLNGNLEGLFWIAFFCIGTYAFAIYLRAQFLGVERKSYRSKKTDLVFKEHKPWFSLYIKELRYYFSIPIYVLNTIIGSVFYLALGGAIAFISEAKIQGLIQSISANANLPIQPLIVVIAGTMIAMVCTTAPSISLEGKQIWILKAHPIKIKDVFLSKILVNLTITIIPIVIVAPIVAINLGISYLFLLLVFPILISIVIAIYGLYFNLLFPKMEWESETAPVKQGLSVMISLFFGFAIVLVPSILYIANVIPVTYPIFAGLLAAFYLLLIGVGIYLLSTSGKKHFEEL